MKIYLLHGLRGSPNGTVKLLQDALEPVFPNAEFIRPALPHHNIDADPNESVEYLKTLKIPKNSILIGVSLGGLVAAKIQETERPDLTVICISTPTNYQNIKINKKIKNRFSFYSSKDEVINDRIAEWPKLAEAHDLPWLTHDTDPHIPKLVGLIKKII